MKDGQGEADNEKVVEEESNNTCLCRGSDSNLDVYVSDGDTSGSFA